MVCGVDGLLGEVLLELLEVARLEHGLDGEEQLPPRPLLADHVIPVKQEFNNNVGSKGILHADFKEENFKLTAE